MRNPSHYRGNLRPHDYIDAAKEKAYECRHQEEPKLTSLEKAFWHKFRKTSA